MKKLSKITAVSWWLMTVVGLVLKLTEHLPLETVIIPLAVAGALTFLHLWLYGPYPSKNRSGDQENKQSTRMIDRIADPAA